HLKEPQRAMVAARMLPQFEEEARERQAWRGTTCNLGKNSSQGRSATKVGGMLNISKFSVSSARKVLDNGCTALVEAVDRGRIAISTAAKLAAFPEDKQQELLGRGRKAIAEALCVCHGSGAQSGSSTDG